MHYRVVALVRVGRTASISCMLHICHQQRVSQFTITRSLDSDPHNLVQCTLHPTLVAQSLVTLLLKYQHVDMSSSSVQTSKTCAIA